MDIQTPIRLRLRLGRTVASTLLAALLFAPVYAEPRTPGSYEWVADAPASGPIVMIASLPEQRLHVYRNGVRIGISTISSGKPGHETPTGTFEILEKRRDHRSNLYNNAPMPFMLRLTWDGIALHGGHLPGHPASHGCIRLPHEFARRLFEMTDKGYVVVVADETSHAADIVYPGERAPVDAFSGEPLRGADTIAAAGSAASAPDALAD